MFDELLPLGSVVLLKHAVRKLMIIGIKVAVKENPEKIYDYMGVFYPEGFLGAETNFLFNNSDINDVIFLGYQNPERDEYIEFLENTLQEAERLENEE